MTTRPALSVAPTSPMTPPRNASSRSRSTSRDVVGPWVDMVSVMVLLLCSVVVAPRSAAPVGPASKQRQRPLTRVYAEFHASAASPRPDGGGARRRRGGDADERAGPRPGRLAGAEPGPARPQRGGLAAVARRSA